MKKTILLITFSYLAFTLHAQKEYPKFHLIPDLISQKYFEPDGIVLHLENGNSLVISSDDFTKIKHGESINNLINLFFEKKDFSTEPEKMQGNVMSYNYIHYLNGDRLTITQSEGKKINNEVDGYNITYGKILKDTINLVRIIDDPVNKSKSITSVFSFRLNHANDLKTKIDTTILNNFIDKIYKDRMSKNDNKNIERKRAKYYGIASGKHVPIYKGAYNLNGNEITGSMQYIDPRRRALVLSGNVGVENYKNYFLSNFILSLGYSINPRGFEGESWTYSIFWKPTFSFETISDGRNKTFTNHFVGLSFDYYLKERSERKINLYVPVSLSYLTKPKGNILQKNTFNLGFGGVKYGAMTLKPSMYFTDFFKNVTPSLQLNVGLGL